MTRKKSREEKRVPASEIPDSVNATALDNPTGALLKQLLTDNGLLSSGEDSLVKTEAVADLLDGLADYFGVHEPHARLSIGLLREAADELRGLVFVARHGTLDDGEPPELVFEGLTFRPRDADEGDGL